MRRKRNMCGKKGWKSRCEEKGGKGEKGREERKKNKGKVEKGPKLYHR